MGDIKQQKIELNKDKRNSTNNKNENDRLNMILSVIDRIYQFFEHKFFPNKQLNKSSGCNLSRTHNHFASLTNCDQFS